MFELTVRLLLSLGLVIGLLLLITKWSGRRVSGGEHDLVRVLGRRSLSRGTNISVVKIGSRILVLGASEQRVDMLIEIEPDELVEDIDFSEYLASDEQTATIGPRGLVVKQTTEKPLSPVGDLTSWVARKRERVVPERVDEVDVPAVPEDTSPAAQILAAELATPAGALDGSILSADTWRKAFAAARGKYS